MAAELTQILIGGSKIKLTKGDYQLVWGSVNPQELNNAQIVVACDATDGEVNVMLPPTTQQQSNFATIWVGKLDSVKNNVTIYPSDGDTINGQSSAPIPEQYNWGFLQNLNGTNWTAIGSGGK